MIVKESIEISGRTYIKSYSDRGVMIHGGSPEADYEEAIDPVERTYTETDIPIEADAEEVVSILLGGAL